MIKFIKKNQEIIRQLELKEGMYKLKGINREFCLQGITKTEEYFLITAYSKTNKNSIIIVYDESFNYIKTIELKTTSHVGGIAYDNIHKIIWISDIGGTITGYKLTELLKNNTIPQKEYERVPVGLDLINYHRKPSVAYITYQNNNIYMGNFLTNKKGILLKYPINNDGTINLSNKEIVEKNFEKKVQGIVFYNEYLIISKSYGRYNPSQIIIYKENNNIYKEKKKIITNIKLSEQLIVFHGNLIIVSEAGSNIYKGKRGYDIAIIKLKI